MAHEDYVVIGLAAAGGAGCCGDYVGGVEVFEGVLCVLFSGCGW